MFIFIFTNKLKKKKKNRQTGSGKTYSMGTSGNHDGIVPRFAKSLFSWLDKNQEQGNFKIRVSFLELYNEDIIDLLGSNGTISIREDSFGNISWTGIKEEVVDSYQGLLK